MDGLRLPTDCCPECKTILDAITGLQKDGLWKENIIPTPGDLSLCVRCGEILVFNPELRLRKATPKDLETLITEDITAFATLIKSRNFILETRKKKK